MLSIANNLKKHKESYLKQPDEISREFIQKILSLLEQLHEDQQDIFLNSFLDNLEMEVEDKTVYDEGRQYAEDALSKCEAFESESDREEFLSDMFAGLKTLAETGSHVAGADSTD